MEVSTNEVDWDTADLLPGDMVIAPDGDIILIVNIVSVDRNMPTNCFGCLFVYKNEIPIMHPEVHFAQNLAEGHIMVKL